MKNLRYILHGSPLQPDNFISEKQVLKELTIIAVLPAAFLGVVVLVGLIPGAGVMDLQRLVKLRYLLWSREERRKSYARAVLLSLNHPITKDGLSMLLAA